MRLQYAGLIAVLVFSQNILAASSSGEMVLTPFGEVPRENVHPILPGQVLKNTDHGYEIVDKITGQVTELSQVNNLSAKFEESGWSNTTIWEIPSGDTLESFKTTWTVPADPVSKNNQTLFLFNAWENVITTNILQPVLQWGKSGAGGGKYWSIASWYVLGNGNILYTPLIQEKAGTVLTGLLSSIPSNIGANLFSYTSDFEDANGNKIPGTHLETNDIPVLNMATETLEVYHVDSCGELPTGTTVFSNIDLKDKLGTQNIDWQIYNIFQDCNQSIAVNNPSSQNGEVTLTY